ncbi:MAG: prepilin-type N-terminal cleavage/methylation domain-containing protein [Proteobacteria bacterium]|nr:prepilin-type N-terminal cleavage/methylation domain-containing protein [Pseudomonadota bacterium]MBT5793639.1 prepilin-type N-terminal cleavage/methylation domain-containing protein [Deltaproteobacteria bacterium]
MIKKSPVCCLRNSGYTLIELMLVLAIASVVLLAAQRPLLEINRIAFQEQQKITLQGDFQRFLLLLKSELIQAGYALGSGSESGVVISTYSVVLKADRNRDGDLADTLETITYRYDPETKSLLRKSGNAAFQTLIEFIAALKFEQTQAPPQTCIKVTVQVIIDAAEQQTVLCQLGW